MVEDEALILLDITGRLQNAGTTVFAACRLDKALDLAGHPHVSAGVLDFEASLREVVAHELKPF